MSTKARRKPTAKNRQVESATCYNELGDEDFYRQTEIDIVRTEHMLAMLTNTRNGAQVDKVELTELLHLLAANLYGTMRGNIGLGQEAEDDRLRKKEHAAYRAACAHWPENLRSEPCQLLRLVA